MELILGFICGIVCCVVIVGIIRKKIFSQKTMGILQIDRSDPIDGPFLFLANCEHPDIIEKNQYVTFKVEVTHYVSQN